MSEFAPKPADVSNTSSKEYVAWMASVWKANDERNKTLETERQRLQDEMCVAEINAGLYE